MNSVVRLRLPWMLAGIYGLIMSPAAWAGVGGAATIAAGDLTWGWWSGGGLLAATLTAALAWRGNGWLRRREDRRLRSLLEEMNHAVLLSDSRTGLLLGANREAEQLFGRERDELVGQHCTVVYPAEMAGEMRRRLHEHAAAGDRLAMATTISRKNGETLAVKLDSSVIETRGRRLVMGVFSIEEAGGPSGPGRHATESYYRQLFELNPTPMWVFDSETMRFLDINPAAIAHYGFSRQEFLAMTVNDIRPPEEMARLKSMVELKTAEFSDSGIWRHRKKDGTLIEVEIICGRLKYAGRPAMMTIANDVTTRRRAEAALRASEERYRSLFEEAVEGIYQSSPDGRFLRANPAAARLLGYANPEDLVARALAPRLYTQPDRYQEFFSRLERNGRLNEFESEIQCGDGHTRWISENARVIRDASGGISYIECFVSDISERKRLEQEMLRTSKLESVGLLAGGIAHDFNNILTVIMGNIALAALDSDAHESVLQLLKAAERATLRARDLTQQLLTFAKGGDPVRTAVNLADIIQESAQFARHGSNVRCDFDLLADLWPANADKGQLAQVLQNLVINAVQAMPEGGIIRITARNVSVPPHSSRPLAAGEYVRIDIADNGGGINPENLAKIFDPYFTTKRQGSGLGLATAYSIVRKHQGQIEVESKPGRGTIFHVWLPALPEAPLGPAVPEPQLSEMTGRVLFMDDDEPIREMAKVMLTRLGFEVTIVADGAAAVDAYRQARDSGRPIDVVVMDLTVPGGMGGKEALEHLRSLDPRVRAVVSSGYSSDPVMANYRNYGFRGMVSKPYKTGDFARVLREVIEEVK